MCINRLRDKEHLKSHSVDLLQDSLSGRLAWEQLIYLYEFENKWIASLFRSTSDFQANSLSSGFEDVREKLYPTDGHFRRKIWILFGSNSVMFDSMRKIISSKRQLMNSWSSRTSRSSSVRNRNVGFEWLFGLKAICGEEALCNREVLCGYGVKNNTRCYVLLRKDVRNWTVVWILSMQSVIITRDCISFVFKKCWIYLTNWFCSD